LKKGDVGGFKNYRTARIFGKRYTCAFVPHNHPKNPVEEKHLVFHGAGLIH
jgi:hypothetical protein